MIDLFFPLFSNSFRPCKVSTSTINEELGEVEYVLTDKTGTLTQNKMILRGLCIGDKLFGGDFIKNDEGDSEFRLKGDTNFDSKIAELVQDGSEEIMPSEMNIANFRIYRGTTIQFGERSSTVIMSSSKYSNLKRNSNEAQQPAGDAEI